MFRKVLLFVMLSVSLACSVKPLLAIELVPYSKADTVRGIIDDKAVSHELKKTLGNDYRTFINNFDMFGEPRSVAGGGLFVEGWLKDLYLESASAFVITPDGKVYAAWVVPESDVINYKDSYNNYMVNNDILQWSERFKGLNFSKNRVRLKGEIEKDRFSTPSFSIELTTFCSEKGSCNDATYSGERKRDGATLTMRGRATRADCAQPLCPVIAYKFKNSSTEYMLSKVDNTLTVIEKGKILMSQKGVWSK